MSTTHIPLYAQGTNGDLIQFSDSAEDYLAYRMGLHLSTMSHDSDASRLNITAGDSAGHALAIGTYTNTDFNEAVGSHAGFTTATNTVTGLAFGDILYIRDSSAIYYYLLGILGHARNTRRASCFTRLPCIRAK